jgi:pSer/pThr/pTyr-binding forkhead associated (FHA) protein
MDITLVLEKRRKRSQSFHLRRAETVVGRQQGSGLRIPSAEVSRRHCLLRVEEDGYLTVEDLDSVNGTYLNGERVSGVEVVRPGDRLQIGPVTLVAEYQLTQAALDRILAGPDAEVVEEDEEAVEAVVEEEEALVEPLGDEECVTHTPANPDPPLPMDEPLADPAESVVKLDENEMWALPQEGDLRDLLSQLDGTDPGAE